MTEPRSGDGAPVGSGRRPRARLRRPIAQGLWMATKLGFGAFVVVALVGQAAAIAVWLASGRALALSTFLRIGWLYVGAFHHVDVVARVPTLDIGRLTGGVLPGSSLPSSGAASVSAGLALLVVTGLATWLLFRGGRRVAELAGGPARRRVLRGALVAPGYAVPIFLVSLLVRLELDVSFGTLASGTLEVRLSAVQSLLVPLAIAVAAGAAGGLASAFGGGSGVSAWADRLDGPLAGGARMLALALALSYAGLFLAGVAQPDGPAGLLTPSTARYFRTMFARPEVGALVLAYHLAAAPNEALWTLVPAMGGSDVVSGSAPATFLSFERFPSVVSLPASPLEAAGSGSGTRFERAPWPYFLFLLVPALATLAGGRWAGKRARARRARDAAAAGAGAGVVFALLVLALGWLGSVGFAYTVDLGSTARSGGGRVGPDLLSGGLLALAWGVIGGSLGALSVIERKRARSSGAFSG